MSKTKNDTKEKALNLQHHVTVSSEEPDKYMYTVPSSDRKDTYNVIRFLYPEVGLNEWTCTCKGFHYRGHTSLSYQCSHIKAVHLALENGIIESANSAVESQEQWRLRKDYDMSNTKILEAQLKGDVDLKVIEALESMTLSEARNTELVITMRVRAVDFKLREATFYCCDNLNGTIVVKPEDTVIDVQVNADNIRDTPLPTDEMESPDLSDDVFGSDPESDNSLTF